eukprot:123604_1
MGNFQQQPIKQQYEENYCSKCNATISDKDFNISNYAITANDKIIHKQCPHTTSNQVQQNCEENKMDDTEFKISIDNDDEDEEEEEICECVVNPNGINRSKKIIGTG